MWKPNDRQERAIHCGGYPRKSRRPAQYPAVWSTVVCSREFECISVLCLLYPKVSQRWGQSVSPAILSLSGSYCSRTSFDQVLPAQFCFSDSTFPFLFNFDGSIVEQWPRESSTHLRGTLIGHQRATTKALSDSQWGRKPSNAICENIFVQSCTICFRRDVTPIELHFRFLFLGVK